jgi:mono/diheme cytochrome c family protein
MTRFALIATLLLSACVSPPASAPKVTETIAKTAASAPSANGPPPPPPYIMRAELPSGDRLASGRSGEALFSNRCGACHLAGGMGSNLLTKQQMLAGQPPELGLLANRTDLTADYVKAVVRQGKVAMPRLSRTEVTDAELAAIANFLGKADK